MMIKIRCEDPDKQTQAQTLEGLDAVSGDASYELVLAVSGIYLQPLEGQHGPIQVDFTSGSTAHRRKFGGGKGQLIAKAVGLKHGKCPSVFDATAGLGGDAFVLASLGCRVNMMELSAIAVTLLEDGLLRARKFAQEYDQELLAIVERLNLLAGDSIEYMRKAEEAIADVVYLDPMFPEKNKNAAAKKEMAAFHVLIGKDQDEAELLAAALQVADKRVVVKRPRLAPPIEGRARSYELSAKSCRYDIYALKSMT